MRLRQLFENIARTGEGKTAVVGWGRGMGHRGHMMLASSVITHAKDSEGDPYFVVSRNYGPDDPLTPEEKLAIYRKVFPEQGHIFQTTTDELPALTHVLTNLNQQGYTNAIVVVGADQKTAFQYLNHYNGKPDKKGNIPFDFENLQVISRQETKDPSREEEGPRATPMRAVLMDPSKSHDEQFAVWRDAMSPEIDDEEVMALMHKAQQRMTQMAAAKKPKKKQGVAEGGAETSWSTDTEKITLQDILELTNHIKQINLPINDNLKSKLIHWDGNPEEIERINQVIVSKQFPILIIVDEQGQIQSILDGNHRLHRAIKAQAKTIPAKLIKPSDLNDKAKRILHINEQGVAEGIQQQYLWHGSRQKIDMLEPRQSVDTGGAAGSNQNAIYATSDPKVAIAMGLTTPGSDTGMFPNDPQMVLFKGKIRKGEYVYLHKLPFNGPDGKPQFVQGGNTREFHSIPRVTGIKPVKIKKVSVNDYMNLIRLATKKDLYLRKKYMKQGVAENLTKLGLGLIRPATKNIAKGVDQKLVTIYTNHKGATIDDNIKKSLPITDEPFNKLQMWEKHKSMKDPKIADWVNNNLLPELEKNGKLKPLLLWNNNGQLFVIDGNHRFIAYQAAGYTGKVPVQIVPDNMITISNTVPS